MTTQESNPADYACGVLQLEAEHYQHQRDQVLAATELMLAALDGGNQWEIDHAIHRAVLTVNQSRKGGER